MQVVKGFSPIHYTLIVYAPLGEPASASGRRFAFLVLPSSSHCVRQSSIRTFSRSFQLGPHHVFADIGCSHSDYAFRFLPATIVAYDPRIMRNLR